MKIPICDFCVAEGKLSLAKYSVRDKRMNVKVNYCSTHKPEIEKMKIEPSTIFDILKKADDGYNALLKDA